MLVEFLANDFTDLRADALDPVTQHPRIVSPQIRPFLSEYFRKRRYDASRWHSLLVVQAHGMNSIYSNSM
jgi:hypothetical protein